MRAGRKLLMFGISGVLVATAVLLSRSLAGGERGPIVHWVFDPAKSGALYITSGGGGALDNVRPVP